MAQATNPPGTLFPIAGRWRNAAAALMLLMLAFAPAMAQDHTPMTTAVAPVDLSKYEVGTVIRLDAALERRLEARFAEVLGVDPAEVQSVGLVKAPPPERFCQLRADAHPHRGHYLRLPRRAPAPRGAAPLQQTTTFSITYDTDFQNDTDAQAAFQQAVDTWGTILNSSQTITVSANWDALGPGILGSAGPGSLWGITVGSNPTQWYSVAMAEDLIGSNLADPDIVARFSNQFSNWYKGSGVPAGNEYDLESIVLHELAHGLGFGSLSNYDDGIDNGEGSSNRSECRNVVSEGCLVSGSNLARFDSFLEDAGGTKLSDTGTYTDPSTTLGSALVSDDVFFDGPFAETANGNNRVELYAPTSWNGGSSIAHLGEGFNGTVNASMTYSISAGEVTRAPGPVTCALFRDLMDTGFVDQPGCAGLPLPVELVAFEARQEGRDVMLTWATATETNNAGFEVEMADAAGEAWEPVGFVAGAGTSLDRQAYRYRLAEVAPGAYRFRLRQADFDGTAAYGPEVELTVEIPTRYELSAVYPNPFNPRAAVTLTVATAQNVRVEVVDALGQRVAVLHEGMLPAHQQQTFVLDAALWPSGLYLVRVIGGTFSDTRRAVLVK